MVDFFGVSITHRQYRLIMAWVWVILGMAFMFAPELALADAAMPWEKPLCDIARSVSGPTANAVAVIVIAATGLLIAFGEVGGIFSTVMKVLFGLSVALLAADWLGLIKKGAGAGCLAT